MLQKLSIAAYVVLLQLHLLISVEMRSLNLLKNGSETLENGFGRS